MLLGSKKTLCSEWGSAPKHTYLLDFRVDKSRDSGNQDKQLGLRAKTRFLYNVFCNLKKKEDTKTDSRARGKDLFFKEQWLR